jgi:tRNA(Ile2) C34 agmatinyltransferase TiaS
MNDDHECPECYNCDGNTHIGTLGFTEHYRCRDCGWDWHERNLGAVQAAYEDACDSKRKERTEEPK